MFSKEDNMDGETEVIGFIGKGMTVEGKLTFDSTVRIDGVFKGEIDAKGTLVVGEERRLDEPIVVHCIPR